MLENSTDQRKSENICDYMACVYTNEIIPGTDDEYSSQPSNFILDSGATCHMAPDISDFIPGALAGTDKYIEVTNENFVTAEKQDKIK